MDSCLPLKQPLGNLMLYMRSCSTEKVYWSPQYAYVGMLLLSLSRLLCSTAHLLDQCFLSMLQRYRYYAEARADRLVRLAYCKTAYFAIAVGM